MKIENQNEKNGKLLICMLPLSDSVWISKRAFNKYGKKFMYARTWRDLFVCVVGCGYYLAHNARRAENLISIQIIKNLW